MRCSRSARWRCRQRTKASAAGFDYKMQQELERQDDDLIRERNEKLAALLKLIDKNAPRHIAHE